MNDDEYADLTDRERWAEAALSVAMLSRPDTEMRKRGLEAKRLLVKSLQGERALRQRLRRDYDEVVEELLSKDALVAELQHWIGASM